MNNLPVFHKSLFESTASNLNVAAWDDCINAYEDKQYLKSIELLFDYINPAFRKKYGSPDGKSFKIPHGSIIVYIKIENDSLFINAPFLDVPENNAVPLLRQITELNFSSLDMAQIFLRENRLNFEYSCKLYECEPYKLYYIFKEICLIGDQYDDKFITQFGAVRLYEPEITPFKSDIAEKCYQTVLNMIKEAMEYVDYFEGKRYFGFAWSTIAATMRKIEYYAHPQGQFRNDLENAISEMHTDKLNVSEIVVRGKNYLEKVLKMDKGVFISELYDVETFIPYKNRSNLKDIQSNFEVSYERVQKAMDDKNYIGACLESLYCFFNMYYNNDLQDDINTLVVNALERSSGKKWEEGAPVLYQAFSKIMNNEIVAKKGFLSRLFGK